MQYTSYLLDILLGFQYIWPVQATGDSERAARR